MESSSGSAGAGDTAAPPKIIQDDHMEQDEVEVDQGLQLLSEVLANNVIGDNVCKYLTLSDMKCASETSKEWCRFIRNSQPFGESAVLRICQGSIAEDNLLVDSECSWKGLAIDITLPLVVIDIVSDMLLSVNHLDLRFARTDKVESGVLTAFLTTLFTATPNLKTLKLEFEFLEQDLHDILSNVKCQEALVKLKKLEIWTCRTKSDVRLEPSHFLDWEVGQDEPFTRNIHQLSCLTFKLESLILGKLVTYQGDNTSHVEFIPNILSSSKETLVELSVHMPEFWKLATVQAIYCPNLKRLSITANGSNGDNVASFINNHPHLEHLSVTLKGNFPTDVLKVVQVKGSKLKYLHLTGKNFVDPGALPNVFGRPNWRFLSDLKALKHFSIRRPFSEELEDSGAVVFLRDLPPTISSLELRGIKKFWIEDHYDNVEILELEDRIPLLQRLENLSSLSLIRCEELLTNGLVQFILGNFTKLQKLEFTHGHALTNFAITGVHPDSVGNDEPGVSLKGLKCLEHLLIKGCNSITVEGLLAAVAHPYLRSLQYLGCFAIPQADVITLVGQNPSLESIQLHIADIENHDDFVAELKKVNQRVCTVTNLIDKETWYVEDSDSDADDPPGTPWGGDGDSDISGGYPDYDDYDDWYDQEVDYEEDGYPDGDYDDEYPF